MVDSTDRDDLAALYFSAEGNSESDDAADADALDFSAAADIDDGGSAADAWDEYAPDEEEGAATELEALTDVTVDDEGEDEDEAREKALDELATTVTNPSGTVSVSALIDGSVHQIELSPKAATMTESELADEILVLAHLARQKGLAGQRAYLLNNGMSDDMREIGLDREVLRDFVENGMGLPTAEQAAAEQAEVFAARYTADND